MNDYITGQGTTMLGSDGQLFKVSKHVAKVAYSAQHAARSVIGAITRSSGCPCGFPGGVRRGIRARIS